MLEKQPKKLDKRTKQFIIITIIIVLSIIGIGVLISNSIEKETTEHTTNVNNDNPPPTPKISTSNLPQVPQHDITLEILQEAVPASQGQLSAIADGYEINGRARVYTTADAPVLQFESGYRISPQTKDLFVYATKEKFASINPSPENTVVLGPIENYSLADRYVFPEDHTEYEIVFIFDENTQEIVAFAPLEPFLQKPVTEKNIPI